MPLIKFLGTGGGRNVTPFQTRRTGGILIKDILIDPGPGSVLTMKEWGIDVRKIKTLLVSHAHPDHITDAPVVIEGMTYGTKRKRGILLASETAINGLEGYRPISAYHLSLLEEWKLARPGDVYKGITVIRAVHTDPSTVGFVVEVNGRIITYYSDTGYWEGMERFARDIVIFNLETTFPSPTHTHPGVVRRVLEASSPKKIFITHFGWSILEYGPGKIARELEKEFGVEVVAAEDGMEWSGDLFDFIQGKQK